MDQQTNSTIGVPRKTRHGNSSKVIITVLVGLMLLGGLVYTNVMLTKATSKMNDLDKRVTKLDGLSGQLNQVITTGANDKILGFNKVNKDGLQSVFLTGGQVYFGKITEITTSNIVLEKVYYLKVGGNEQSLVKLGCETHKPEDKLTIVRSNVQLWENLKADDAKGVTSAIKQYEAANPTGQKCS